MSRAGAFAELSHAGQVRRMRRLAQTALAAYPVPVARLRPLAHMCNTTFRVDAADHSYVLRIHRAEKTTASVRSELAWLTAIRRDTQLVVPEPVATYDNDLLTVAADPDVPEPRTCVLFRWVDGRFCDDTLGATHLWRVGVFMARLHQHAAQFTRPGGFDRGPVDYVSGFARTQSDNLSPDVAAHVADLIDDAHPAGGGDAARAVVDRARRVREALRDRPGLIHADLHQENFLFHDGHVRAIDFDDCGYGHAAYDLAVTLQELQHRAAYPALRTALLDGYRSVRPLPAEQEAAIDTFVALRRVQLVVWFVEERDHPAFRTVWEDTVARGVAALRRFLATAD